MLHTLLLLHLLTLILNSHVRVYEHEHESGSVYIISLSKVDIAYGFKFSARIIFVELE
jgi:hypothetical protein